MNKQQILDKIKQVENRETQLKAEKIYLERQLKKFTDFALFIQDKKEIVIKVFPKSQKENLLQNGWIELTEDGIEFLKSYL